jgi:hypothetical protein
LPFAGVSVSLEPIIRDLVALYLEDLVKNRNFVASYEMLIENEK